MTKIYNWSENINENELDNCIEVLRNGGIVIFPTETVYGIGTNAYCEKSVEKIYEIKERPEEKPLSILVSNVNEISKYAIINNSMEEQIIKNFMPGPITIILEKRPEVFDYITSGKNTIGIRIPDNRIILKILEDLKLPIVAPSANISGHPSGIELNEILPDFENKVDICIDGGKSELSESSTIVQVVDNEIKILRQGKILKQDIENILNKKL